MTERDALIARGLLKPDAARPGEAYRPQVPKPRAELVNFVCTRTPEEGMACTFRFVDEAGAEVGEHRIVSVPPHAAKAFIAATVDGAERLGALVLDAGGGEAIDIAGALARLGKGLAHGTR